MTAFAPSGEAATSSARAVSRSVPGARATIADE
ncbi:Uncharacterised protein [Mycobacteroides abscessus]|nr:Uncharacterised protein [Mycobacteroides abscessus]